MRRTTTFGVLSVLATVTLILGLARPVLALDGDGDGTDDAVDPCNNVAPTTVSKASLSVRGLLTPGGDDEIRFKGTVVDVPSMVPISPATNGFRILLTDATGATTVDILVPPGAYNGSTGWKTVSAGILYRNNGKTVPLVQGIAKVSLRRRLDDIGTIRFAVSGKQGAYPIDIANLPITGTVVFAPPLATNGQCGEWTAAACVVTGGGNNLKCE